MVIKGLGGVAMPATPGKVGVGGPGFRMGASAVAEPVRMSAAAALDGLLLLQEATDAPARDRRARKHGRAVLDALSRLQLGLLGADAHPQTLRDLADLAESCPDASDPALKDALAAVVLRAKVELARRSL